MLSQAICNREKEKKMENTVFCCLFQVFRSGCIDSGEWREMLGEKIKNFVCGVFPFSFVSVLRDVRAHVVWELVSLGD